jgi:hypothetical protein
MTDDDLVNSFVPPTTFPGVGGVNAEAFKDWDRFTEIKPMKPAISWLESGQFVLTPYGEGTMEASFPPETPEPSPDSHSGAETAENHKGAQEGTKHSDFQKSSNRKKNNSRALDKEDEKSPSLEEQNKYSSLKPLRVKVRLPYGVGFFGMDAILKMDSPANYSDAQLAKRWKGMVESALKVGPCIDVQGMTSKPEKQSSDRSDLLEGAMDIDDAARNAGTDAAASDAADDDRFLPVGASLFPTKGGRGYFLHKMSIDDIEKGLQKALYGGHGVLGMVCLCFHEERFNIFLFLCVCLSCVLLLSILILGRLEIEYWGNWRHPQMGGRRTGILDVECKRVTVEE